MPIIKSAIKKMRQDKKRKERNSLLKEAFKNSLKKMQKISEVFSKIDKATKKGVIHKNKAARLKSRYAKLAKSNKK